MRFEEYLGWSLTEVHDLCFFADLYLRIVYFFEVNRILISKVVEEIEVLLCNFTLLLIAKYKIYPFL